MLVTDRHMQLSASSAALDLALSQSPGPESGGWGAFTRHRTSQSQQITNTASVLGLNGTHANGSSTNGQNNISESPSSSRSSTYRHSLDGKYMDNQETTQMTSPKPQATPPKLQSSYSANDVPTMRSSNGVSMNTTPNSHAQQHLHNHNASLGRIPPNAINNRLSREVTSPEAAPLRDVQNGAYQSISSALHPNAPSFGPSLSQSMAQPMAATITSPNGQPAYPVQPYYNNYNMGMMAMGMQNMQLTQPMYSPQMPYGNYGGGAMYQPAPQRDSQARVIQQRRQNDGEGK